MNPNLQYAEVVRGENNNNGTMRGILHGKYLPDVIDAIRLIQHSPSWSKQDQQGMECYGSVGILTGLCILSMVRKSDTSPIIMGPGIGYRHQPLLCF